MRALVNFVFGLKKPFLALSVYKDVITHLVVSAAAFLETTDVDIKMIYMLKALKKEICI